MPTRHKPLARFVLLAATACVAGAGLGCKDGEPPAAAPATPPPLPPYAGPLDVARLTAAKVEIESLTAWADAAPKLRASVGEPRVTRRDGAGRTTWHWAVVDGEGDAASCVELIAGRSAEGRLVEASLSTAYAAAGALFQTCSDLAAMPPRAVPDLDKEPR